MRRTLLAAMLILVLLGESPAGPFAGTARAETADRNGRAITYRSMMSFFHLSPAAKIEGPFGRFCPRIGFAVGPQGELLDSWIAEGSANANVDQAMLRAFRRVGPFPPPPRPVPEGGAKFTFNACFTLN